MALSARVYHISYSFFMNTQFKSTPFTSSIPFQNREQVHQLNRISLNKDFTKNGSFGKEDSNANANTNCPFVANDYDDSCHPNQAENSNHHAINFDKYFKMKGQLQQAKRQGDGQIQFDQAAKLHHSQEQVQSEQQHTVPLNRRKGKIQVDITEEVTNRYGKKFKQIVQQQIKKQKAAQPLEQTAKKQSLKKKAASIVSEDHHISIVKNIKVETILNKAPLRARYSALLQDHEKYQIGFEHKALVKLLEVMDNTLDYLKSYRNNKSTFFSTLQTNFNKNSGPELSYEKLKKLLFLQQTLYEIEWALKDSSHKYDLIIRLPQSIKFQERKSKLRKKIVHYLLAKQAQYLQSNNLKKTNTNNWADGFQPNSYKIPQKQLPIHPLQMEVSVKGMSEAQINAIPNSHLRTITADMKKQYQSKCLKSEEVISMIFSKTQKHKFEQKLYASIRQKQKMMKEIKPPVEQVNKQLIINVLVEIQYIYNSKNVTNIFRSTLEQKLLKSLPKFANQSILQSLKIIIEAKDILFLKEQLTSNNTLILQINRAKYQDMKARIQSIH